MKHLLFILLIASVTGCSEQHLPQSPVVDMWGIDNSLSYEQQKLPDTAFLRRAILTAVDGGGAYTIAIGTIGDPSDKPLAVASFPTRTEVDYSAAPSIRDRQRKAQDSIATANHRQLTSFLQSLQHDALGYAPDAAYTSINDFLRKADVISREEVFCGAHKRLILISDGLQDSVGVKGDTIRNPFKGRQDVELLLVGCKNVQAFNGSHIQQFQSIDDLLLYLQQSSQSPSKQ